ncbi:NAD(P)H-binding family protein [Ceratobasidium sp. AG-Ba]|nr:NAD(P)H-binding family protein [Ceratobasidium sp. AG-Ba]QRW10681.1 NAD(P)H-binding family protein [Ceratobasidium sp. AG-Ba]
MRLLILGGHGKVALHLARLAANNGHAVTSVIRDPAQSTDIQETGASPSVLSLEDASVSEFTKLFTDTGAQVVYFAAGAGGKGGEERTKAVDYGGALKTFDAIDAVAGKKPRLVLVSGLDVGNEDRFPEHYNEADKQVAERIRKAIATWYKWKYEAEKVLVKRTSFEWIILRPGGLSDNPGAGTADIGRTHITSTISREDVAAALLHLASVPSKASGLGIDMAGGNNPIGPAIDAFIERGVTDWLGQA